MTSSTGRLGRSKCSVPPAATAARWAVELRDAIEIDRQRRCLSDSRQQLLGGLGGVVHGQLTGDMDGARGVTLGRGQRDHGNASFATAASSWSGWNGLTTQALTPAAWPAFFFSSWPSVVSMMMGVNL
jgi:hypothetical protein